MTDLSYASHAEIVLELQRRYPVYILAVVHPSEGQLGLNSRVDFGSKSGSPHDTIGLANFAVMTTSASEMQKLNFSRAPSGTLPSPLDPPSPPPPRSP